MDELKLGELEKQRVSKFHQLAGRIAADLGYGNYDEIGDDQKARVGQRVELIVECWEESEMKDTPPEPSTPLERVLREYHEICEQILDIRGEAAA